MITHPERVLFPDDGINQGDVVGYYERVAERMLPHLVGRPLTLNRFPEGIAKEGFFQKNAAKHYPAFIDRIELPKRKGTTVHPAVHDAEGLTYLANQGALEFHIPLGRLPHVWQPDRMVFDLDPPADAFGPAREAALAVRSFLAELGITSRPMATGSKGFHVVLSLTPKEASDDLSEIARKAASLVVRRHPDLLTDEFRIENRKGRVFVDWLRNRFTQTVVAPWSLRARPGAPVARPIEWDALAGTAPNGLRLRDVVAMPELPPDPLRDLEASPVDPESLIASINELARQEELVLPKFDRFRS